MSGEWHDTESEYVPLEVNFDTAANKGAGFCVEGNKLAVFLHHDEVVKLNKQLSDYLEGAIKRN